MKYTVDKEKGGQWFCHPVDSMNPVQGSFGDKKKAVSTAAKMNGMTVKEFLKERKKADHS